jgi:hypothetical protein
MINERLAKLLGKDVGEGEHRWVQVTDTEVRCQRCAVRMVNVQLESAPQWMLEKPCMAKAPLYDESLDALARDVLPVLRERGWRDGRWSVWENTTRDGTTKVRWFVEITRSSLLGSPSEIHKVADSPAAALAEAAAIALEAD